MRIRVAVVSSLVILAATAASAQDPREGLGPGYIPWDAAALGLDHTANRPRVPPFDAAPGNFGFINSDLAFRGNTGSPPRFKVRCSAN